MRNNQAPKMAYAAVYIILQRRQPLFLYAKNFFKYPKICACQGDISRGGSLDNHIKKG